MVDKDEHVNDGIDPKNILKSQKSFAVVIAYFRALWVTQTSNLSIK